jgi:hypothetical protein
VGPTKLLQFNDALNTYSSSYHGIRALFPYRSWFPLFSSPELAGLVADLIGDGHLQGRNKWRLDYTSKYATELERFNSQVRRIFGVSGHVRPCLTNTYGTKNLGINNKPLSRVLNLIGVPCGNKVFTEFFIPSWILENKPCFARFVNRLFCCEGTVDLNSKCLDLQMYKSLPLIHNGLRFFLDLQNYLLKHFNIITTSPFLESRINIRKDGFMTKAVRIKIKSRDSLSLFKEHIGIEDKRKMRRLNLILASF